ncbi:MAG: ABC transporter substrate-binding protein [Oscillospiraceae bacterium]
MKKLLTCALALLLVAGIFGACTSSGGNSSPSTSAPVAQSSASSENQAASEAPSDAPAATSGQNAPEAELTTLSVVMMSADKPDKDLVVADVNKILGEKLNINIDLTFISYGNYVQQTTLMLSSGEGVDVLPVYMTPLNTVANNGQIIPLDDLLAEYGQGIPDAIGQHYLECGRVGEDLYGITTGRDLAKAYGFLMGKEMADRNNIDYDSIKDLDALEEALRVIKANEPDLIPVVVYNGEIFRNWGWDSLGDDMINLGVLMDYGQDLTVTNLYETEFYRDLVIRMRRWYQDGLIMQDALNNTETGGQMIKADKGFGSFSNLKPGYNEQETRNNGVEIVTSWILPAYACTSDVQMATWAISNGSKHPEASMKLLNEMYTNPEISNLLIYGQEGPHYVVAGEANTDQHMIAYPEGIDATNTGYRPSGWLWPNQTIGDVWEGNPPDYWQQQTEFNNTALRSKAFGFTYDSARVKNQVTACTNVVSKYHQALLCGTLDPETTLPVFIQELKDAGVDDIVAEKQRQIDEWAAANGIEK